MQAMTQCSSCVTAYDAADRMRALCGRRVGVQRGVTSLLPFKRGVSKRRRRDARTRASRSDAIRHITESVYEDGRLDCMFGKRAKYAHTDHNNLLPAPTRAATFM